jgi:hypothetical protein
LDEPFSVVGGFLGRLLHSSKGKIYICSNSRDVIAATVSWNNAEAQPHFQESECWAQLRDQSTRASLTSLYNRRHFLDAVRCKIRRVRSDVGVVSIISKPSTIHASLMQVIWFCGLD